MPQLWKCPFCSSTSSRPQGLAAHIRYGHVKQYPKWLKNPNRIEEARQGALQETETEASKEQAPELAAESVEGVQLAAQSSENPTEQLLVQAQAQLVARKSVIEAELARLDDLREEIKTIEKQLESLNSTLAIFRPEPAEEKAEATSTGV